jgi:hypothetical protein
MKAIHLGVLCAVLLGAILLSWVHEESGCWPVEAPVKADLPPFLPDLPPAVREVVKQFEEEALEMDRKVEGEIKAQVAKTTQELRKIQDLFCKQAKLDEAVAVRDLIRSLQTGSPVVPNSDLPASAREVYKVHEDAVAEISKKAEAEFQKRRDKVAVELKKVQDEFCKAAKLDEAVAVRDLLRMLKEGVTNALPDPGYVNNGTEDIGKVFYFQTTGVTTGQAIYGTDVYTNGSHLGMAAVHCGILKEGQKGVVKVTILPGQGNYPASTRFGVTSQGWGNWNVSFKVERVLAFLGKQPAAPLP